MTTTQVPTEAFDKLLLLALSAALELDDVPGSELAYLLVNAVIEATGVPVDARRWAGEVWCDLLIDGVIGDEPFREFLEEIRAGREADVDE